MERYFQSCFSCCGSQAHLLPATGGQSSDQSSFDAMFSGVSLENFLSANHEQSLLPLFGDSGTGGAFPTSFPGIETPGLPTTYRFLSEDFPSLNHKHLSQTTPTNSDHRLKSLKLPKNEPFYAEENPNLIPNPNESTQPFNFFSDSTFNHLPRLQSLEHLHSSSSKGIRFNSISYPETLDSTVQHSFYVSPYNSTIPSLDGRSSSPVVPHRFLARQRRQKISDKTRCLQKLMPWDKKMDISTMLEEAYKYVKFLQAQISALQSMPVDSSFALTPQSQNIESECFRGMFGGLGRLNRQQLLQVLVNSPVAQTMLYSEGCCVFSVEQLVLLKKIAERRVVLQQMPFDPAKLS